MNGSILTPLIPSEVDAALLSPRALAEYIEVRDTAESLSMRRLLVLTLVSLCAVIKSGICFLRITH